MTLAALRESLHRMGEHEMLAEREAHDHVVRAQRRACRELLQAVLLLVDDVREEPTLAEVRAKVEALPRYSLRCAEYVALRDVLALHEPRKPERTQPFPPWTWVASREPMSRAVGQTVPTLPADDKKNQVVWTDGGRGWCWPDSLRCATADEIKAARGV